MDAANKRPVGTTTLGLSQMGFGAVPLGNLFTPLSEKEAFETIQAALAAGIRYFDTAPFYGHGLSEHRLSTALRAVPRDDFTLSTKVGRQQSRAPPKQCLFFLPVSCSCSLCPAHTISLSKLLATVSSCDAI